MTEQAKKRQRWVVKVGSNLLCSGGPLLIRAYGQQIAALRRDFHLEIIWVTSGAIASAVERTGFRGDKRTLPEKQALSAMGQPILMDLYNLSLQAVGLMGAQILLTYDDMADQARRANLQNTLEKLLEWNAVPILNENDAVATEEIRFGDNDSLSAKVAAMLRADRLVILTDVEGLFDRDPQKDPGAKRIARVDAVTDAHLVLVGKDAGSPRGTGGMYSKLMAAREAASHGIETWLAKGDIPGVLVSLASNADIGTRFGAQR